MAALTLTHFTNPLQEQCRTGTHGCSTSSNICLKTFFLINLCALRQTSSVWGGREAPLLSAAGRHHSWPPTVPSSCFLTAVCIAPVSTSALFLIFCLLYTNVFTALERIFLHLPTVGACKWGDLAFKRFLAVFKLRAVRHPWATWAFFSSLSPSLSTRNDSSKMPHGHQSLATFSVARFVCQD